MEHATCISGRGTGGGTRKLGFGGNAVEDVATKIRHRRVQNLSIRSCTSRRYITVVGPVLDEHAVYVPISTTLSCCYATFFRKKMTKH